MNTSPIQKLSLICSVEIDDEYRRLKSRKLWMTAAAALVVVSNGMEEGRTNSSSEHLNLWFRPSAARSEAD